MLIFRTLQSQYLLCGSTVEKKLWETDNGSQQSTIRSSLLVYRPSFIRQGSSIPPTFPHSCQSNLPSTFRQNGLRYRFGVNRGCIRNRNCLSNGDIDFSVRLRPSHCWWMSKNYCRETVAVGRLESMDREATESGDRTTKRRSGQFLSLVWRRNRENRKRT